MCCTRDLVAGMATCGTRRGSAGGPVVHVIKAAVTTRYPVGTGNVGGSGVMAGPIYRGCIRSVALNLTLHVVGLNVQPRRARHRGQGLTIKVRHTCPPMFSGSAY